MRTLIVPCVGSKIIESLPIFLNRHPDGELLGYKALMGVYPERYDRILFAVLKDTDIEFHASKIIKEENIWSFPVDVVLIEHQTSGPAETVYQAIKEAGVCGEFAVRDSHVYIKVDEDARGNFIAGLDLTKYEKPIENLRSKSFVVLNEQGQILDIIEKHFSSDVISVGLYGFKKADDFVMAFEHLNDPNYAINKLYISHIISYLIGYKRRIFHAVHAVEFQDWSTKTSWQKVQKNHSICFIDIDGVFIGDNPYAADNELMRNMRSLTQAGARFIGFTTHADDGGFMKLCVEQNINMLSVVCNCPFSRIKTVAVSSEDITRMTLEL